MKRRSAADGRQLGFTFEAPRPATLPGSLAGIEAFVAGLVAVALKEDARSRDEVAGAMSSLAGPGAEVTRWMLDAYASEAREAHNISAGRFLALIAATGRHDLLDAAARRIGAAVLVGEELHTARLGHLDVQIKALKAERARLADAARPIGREGGRC